jgi:hypothetical protein
MSFQKYLDNPNREQENLEKNLQALIEKNKELIYEYKRTKVKDLLEFETENPYLQEISKELDASHRLRYGAFFWSTFYIFGTSYVSKNLNWRGPYKWIFMLSFLLPNFIFYKKKFEVITMNLHEIVLKDKINKYITIKDPEVLKLFIDDYKKFAKISSSNLI